MERGSVTEVGSYGRSAARLTVSVGVAGALVYIFFALASHNLDREEYGRIVVLWTAMFLAISVLFRPVELLLARNVAERKERGASGASEVRVAATIQIALGVVFLVAVLLLKGEIENRLFDGESLFFWALVGSVLGFGASYAVRGWLAGHSWFGLYSLLLLSDAASRTAFALAVAIGLADGPDPLAVGIAIAPGLSVLAVLYAFRRSPPQMDGRAPLPQSTDYTLLEGGGFAASVLVIVVAEQIFLNSGPLLALERDGATAAGFIFNVLMLIRAPVILFHATATSLLPALTRMSTSETPRARAEFGKAVRNTLAGVVSFTALTALAVAIAGPALMQLAFGDSFEYDRLGLLIVAVSMGLYLAATTLTQAVLALGGNVFAAASWACAGLALSAWYLTSDLAVDRLVEVGLAASAALLCALLGCALRGQVRRSKQP